MTTYTTLIVLPDGTELASGSGTGDNIRGCTITYSSNDGDDLMLGSVCSAVMEVKIQSPGGDFSVAIGDKLIVYKVDMADGTRTQIGVFNVEEPKKISEHIYKITAYDNVRLLDVDMTDWLRGLTGWPYKITDFYAMICEKCGLEWGWNSWNGIEDFMIHKFDVKEMVTGRQLVSWVAEIMGDYCIANPDGSLQCNWYRTSYFYLYPSTASMSNGRGTWKQIYYQGTLSHGDFDVKDVNFAQVREDSSEDSVPWPEIRTSGTDTSNPYIITGNPILLAHPTYLTTSYGDDSVREALKNIADRFDFNTYRPFKVEIPEFLEVRVGRYAFVCNENTGIVFIAPVTSLVWTGHKMKLECTAKQTRSTADSPANMTNADLVKYSDTAAAKAIQTAAQTAMEAQALAMHKVSTNAEIDSVLTNELTAMPLRSYKVVCLSVDKNGLDLIGGMYHVTLYKHDSKYWHCDATKYSIAVVTKASRSYYNGSWGKWGYSSPPMSVGVEYPTDRIWNGSVVYTTVIDCGTWAAGGAINTNITCSRIIEYRGAVGVHCLPFGSSIDANNAKIGVFNNSGKIRIGMIGGSGLTSNDTLIQLFYTKP